MNVKYKLVVEFKLNLIFDTKSIFVEIVWSCRLLLFVSRYDLVIYIYYNEAKLNMTKTRLHTVILLITISLFGSPEIFLCKSELFNFCNTIPCRWLKVASVKIILIRCASSNLWTLFLLQYLTLCLFCLEIQIKRNS